MIIFCYSSDDGAPFYNCLLCHVPYKPNSAPFPVNLSVCAICRYAQISRDYTFHFETTSCMKTMQLFGMVFFKIYTFNNILFLKIQKNQLLLHLKMNNDLNFDFIFLQEAKGAWCFVYNHRSSTGNTNPRQRRIFTSQVSHKCAQTHLVIISNCRIMKSAVILWYFVFTEFVDQNQKAKAGNQTQRRSVTYDDIFLISLNFKCTECK